MIGLNTSQYAADLNTVSVMLDGIIVGKVYTSHTKQFCSTLRLHKVQRHSDIPSTVEIYCIPDNHDGLYPLISLYTTPQRVVRPVAYLHSNGDKIIEWVGAQEQLTLDIAIKSIDYRMNETTHMEIQPNYMFSVVSSFTPFSDFNQSPRNMYQCLSIDHDVLTRHGWKSIDSIQIDEQVMTMNLSTGKQQWNAVTAVHHIPHNGDAMYRLHNMSIDVVCNDQHRWWCRNTEQQVIQYQAYTTNQIINNQIPPQHKSSGQSHDHWDGGSHRVLRVPLIPLNPHPMYTFPETVFLSLQFTHDHGKNLDWCRFIGFIVGNGGVEKCGNDYYTHIFQSNNKSAGKQYVLNLVDRLYKYDPILFDHSVSTYDDKVDWRFKHVALYNYFLPITVGPIGYDPLNDTHCRTYSQSHYRSQGIVDDIQLEVTMNRGDWLYLRRWMYYDWIFTLHVDQARALLEGYVAADGDWSSLIQSMEHSSHQPPRVHREFIRAYSSSIPLVQDLTIIGIQAQARVSVTANHQKDQFMPSINSTSRAVGWRVQFNFDEIELSTPLPKPSSYINPRHNGMIYCLSLANGNFLARRQIQWTDATGQRIPDISFNHPFITGNCQMGKQTMGTPYHAFIHRTDNKVFRIQNPQSPIVRNKTYERFGVDEYPTGTNAVVAVISYTGM